MFKYFVCRLKLNGKSVFYSLVKSALPHRAPISAAHLFCKVYTGYNSLHDIPADIF